MIPENTSRRRWAAEGTSALAVRNLRVELNSGAAILEDVSLAVQRGEILGLVGESGSGKTTTALALLGYATRGTHLARGDIVINQTVIAAANAKALRELRGRVVSYVPQDPANSLNPALRICDSIRDIQKAHSLPSDGPAGVTKTLARVGLPSDPEFARRYPHQLSGGQQQRILIGMALMCQPAVVVLDEPTTGLDVVTQARILDEIERLRRELFTTMVYVSHDLALVGKIADRIAVMYAGEVVEEGSAGDILTRPRHPYTRGLIDSIPDIDRPRAVRGIPGFAVAVGQRPVGCAFAPRCQHAVNHCTAEMPVLEDVGEAHAVRCFEWRRIPTAFAHRPERQGVPRAEGRPLLRVVKLSATHGHSLSQITAAENITFRIAPGECVALVGESGSGKTTIARCVAGLHAPAAGEIFLDGEQLAPKAKRRSLQARRRIQLISQNPYESLNPRHRIIDEIARPARILRNLSSEEAKAEAMRLLERVRLSPQLAESYPAELSGGERQRVAIARALAAGPDLLICDEVTSALDVSVQGAVLALLSNLRQELHLAVLVITHDLGVVATIADHVLVLERGLLREEGTPERVLKQPSHPYTRQLLEAVPRMARPQDIFGGFRVQKDVDEGKRS
jgi:peptide/nickel transport system ATP-binding protein